MQMNEAKQELTTLKIEMSIDKKIVPIDNVLLIRKSWAKNIYRFDWDKKAISKRS